MKPIITHNSAIVGITPSLFDGKPVLILATGFTTGNSNDKLGQNVIQVFYLREDLHPQEGLNTGADFSVCRNCPLKPTNSKVCYVKPTTIISMWNAYKRGSYPPLSQIHLREIKTYRKVLRLGAYGEPTCVPLKAVQPLIDASVSILGYTHQWRAIEAIPYKEYLQASVETLTEAKQAQALGWKTYRIVPEGQSSEPGETLCPWHLEGKDFKTCDLCRKCNGKVSNIISYPTTYKHRRFDEYMATIDS